MFDTHIVGFDVEKARAILLHRLSDLSGLLGTNALYAVACCSSETLLYLRRPSNDLWPLRSWMTFSEIPA